MVWLTNAGGKRVLELDHELNYSGGGGRSRRAEAIEPRYDN